MMWKWWANMPKEMKAYYKIVLTNPELQSPLANMSYGDFFTAYGIDWAKHPHIKEEWLHEVDNSKSESN